MRDVNGRLTGLLGVVGFLRGVFEVLIRMVLGGF